MAGILGAVGGILGSLLGGGAGAANTRPPALNPQQSGALSTLLGGLTFDTQTGNNISFPVNIDPRLQNMLYDQIARSRAGADIGLTHSLVSRGLGNSGLLGAGLIQNQNQASANQLSANQGLLQQALQTRQMNLKDILQLLNVNATPGQSKGGGFLAGLAPVAAYSIQNMINSRGGGGAFNFASPTSDSSINT